MSSSFCSLPWLHLATHPHGGATLCCQSEMQNGLSAAANEDGNDPITLNERLIPDLINSKKFREVRLSMLAGERHAACAPCWEREEMKVMSKRLYDNQRFPMSLKEAANLTAPDGSITPNIQFAELRLGNTCNVKCVTCNPNSSNTYAREHNEMIKDLSLDFLRDYSWVTPQMSDWTKDLHFWENLALHTPHLKEVYINGGEPMLIKQHVAFLEQLVREKRASTVKLTYSINMTRLLEEVRPLWKEFSEVHFSCSIDDWNEKNFYIRYPTSWDKVTNNFEKLLSWGFHPHVLQTVSALNFFGLDDFYRKWQKLFPNSIIAYNDVIDPPWFSPLSLAPKWRKDILQRLQKTLPPNLQSQMQSMYGDEAHESKHLMTLKHHLKSYDHYRDTNVCDYFPELEAYLRTQNESLRVGD
jgi:hypothetical protein